MTARTGAAGRLDAGNDREGAARPGPTLDEARPRPSGAVAVAATPSRPVLPRGARWALVAAAAVVLVGWGFAEMAVLGVQPPRGWSVAAVLVLAWVVACLALLRRGSGLGRLAALPALAGAVTLLGFALGIVGAPPLPADLLRAAGAAALPATALHALLALPTGELARPGRRRTAALGYGAALVAAVGWLVGPRAGAAWAVGVGFAVAVALGALPAHRRYRASAGLSRQRLQLLGCSVALAAATAGVLWALRLMAGWPADVAELALAATIVVPFALLSGSTPLVTRADRAVAATTALVGLSLVVLAVAALVVLGLGHRPERHERDLFLLALAGAAGSAVLYLPVRDRLTDRVQRLVHGERRVPEDAVRTFGTRLSRAVPMDELLLQLVESLRRAMGLTAAEVWTGAGGRLDRAVSVPVRGPGRLEIDRAALPVVARAGVSGTAWASVWLPALVEDRPPCQLRVVPVSHSGDLLGLLVLERAVEAEHFAAEEDRVLGDLARQVALALHNVQLDSALQASLDEVRRYAGELQESRARIVATADAERRRIERNLHDGAQQHLVALAVSLRMARDLVGEDPAAAADVLDALASDVKETIQELRDLAHGIYPPLLMDSGLTEALRAAAGRNPLAVSVDAAVGRFPTEAEAAVYFCCVEALQNAAKHAPGSQVEVRVWEDEDAGLLRFEVSDDGPGFDVGATLTGQGYVNMCDRLGAIGGEVQWHSTPGIGTVVVGGVPVRP